MARFSALTDGNYHILMIHKQGSSYLKNVKRSTNHLRIVENIDFFNTDLNIVIPIRNAWSRFVSGQVQDLMSELKVEYTDGRNKGIVSTILADDSILYLFDIKGDEVKHFLNFRENLMNGIYLDDIAHDYDSAETLRVGRKIMLQLFNHPNHEWWFDAHTWPSLLLSRCYIESKLRNNIHFVKIEDLTSIVNSLFNIDTTYFGTHTKKDVLIQLNKINTKDDLFIDRGFIFGSSDNFGLTSTESKLFRQLFEMEEYYYKLICSEYTHWWEHD